MKKSCKALLAMLLSATVFLASCDTPDIHGPMPYNWTLYSYEELYGFFCGDPVTGVSEGTEESPEPIGRYIFGDLDETAPAVGHTCSTALCTALRTGEKYMCRQ